MASLPQSGMKKRQIIANSNKQMFIWVAAMSAVVGVCAVLSYFLIQQIAFKAKVVEATQSTATTLSKNLKAATPLAQNIQAMEANTALNQAKTDDDEKALRVILDALPADPNTLALGSSIQQKLVTDIPGVSIESLTMQPLTDSSGESTNSSDNGHSTLPFTMTVKSPNADGLKQLLAKFERSIRTIDIDSLIVERSGNGYTMTMEAHAYYEPAQTVTLGSKIITPNAASRKTKK